LNEEYVKKEFLEYIGPSTENIIANMPDIIEIVKAGRERWLYTCSEQMLCTPLWRVTVFKTCE
jgi:hypothetical protein